MANPTDIGIVAAGTVLLTTELNSLANNSSQISSVGGTSGVFANVNGSGLGGYPRGRLKLLLQAIASAFTANGGLSVWFLRASDGTNYESGSSSVNPARAPDAVLPVIAQTAIQIVEADCFLPIVATFKVLVQNNATGQAFNASGNTLTIYPVTDSFPSL